MHDYDDYKYYIDGQVINLSESQNELLDLFIKNKNHLVTFEEIIRRLRFEDYEVYMKPSISLLVHKLRRKCNLHISTIYGRGYSLRED